MENAFHNMTGGEALPPRNPDMPVDATQRVRIDNNNTGAPRRPAGSSQSRPSGAAPVRNSGNPQPRQAAGQPQRRAAGSANTPPARKRKTSASKRKNTALIISLFAIAAVA